MNGKRNISLPGTRGGRADGTRCRERHRFDLIRDASLCNSESPTCSLRWRERSEWCGFRVRRRSGKVVAEGVGDGVGAAAGADLGVDIDEMTFDGVDAEREGGGNLLVAVAIDEQVEDFDLSSGEARGRGQHRRNCDGF